MISETYLEPRRMRRKKRSRRRSKELQCGSSDGARGVSADPDDWKSRQESMQEDSVISTLRKQGG